MTKLSGAFEAEIARRTELKKRNRAACVIQAEWKRVLTRRRFLRMKSGFVGLQRSYRIRLRKLRKERLKESLLAERRFERKMEVIEERLKSAEREFERLKKEPLKPFKHIFGLGAKAESGSESDDDELDPFSQSFFDREARRHRAAAVIQTRVRRWLIRRRHRRPIWSRELLQSSALTEAKVRKYEDEIALTAQRLKLPPMSSSEHQDLHQRAQFQFARFAAAVNRKRVQDHRTLANLAQTEAILSVLEAAPNLNEYDQSQWADFHSLPLSVATKARLEHKAALERLKLPKWKRILDDEFPL